MGRKSANGRVCGLGVYDSSESATSKENLYFYDRWRSILERCSAPRQQSYDNVTLCDEWVYFSNFKKWVLSQNFEGLHLDKDILVRGNRMYHPERCVFVPQYVNNIFRRLKKTDSDKPHGVFTDKNNKTNPYFTTKICSDGVRRRPVPATNCIWKCHANWQKSKIETFEFFLDKYLQEPHTDTRVIDSIQRLLDDLYHQYINGLETKEI